MKSKLKIFAAIACVATLCLALVGCGGDKSAEWKKAVVGTWEVTEITGTSQDDIDMMKAFGLNVELVFQNDDSFKLGMFGETIDGTWKATSADKVVLKAEGDEITCTLKDDVLSIDVEGDVMKFKKVSDEPKEIKAADFGSASGDSGTSATADQEVVSIDKVVLDNEIAKVTVIDKKKDWIDSCGYTIKVENKSDAVFDITTVNGTWVVNGKMCEPFYYETVQPGAYAETFVSFSTDKVKDLSELVNVKGELEICDSDTLDTILTFPLTLE